jgi:hypothetical protein
MTQLSWNKCQGEVWCNLLNVNLDHPHFDNMSGVYIIWHGGQNARTVRVGSGVIRDRLRAHREDPAILQYRQLGLFVTWAAVSGATQRSVEKYLADRLRPLVGERFPDVPQEVVNLPWKE